MKCIDVLKFLDPLVDDELPADTTAVVMDHLKRCSSCSQEWTFRLFLRRQFEELDNSIVVPEHGLHGVRRRLEEFPDSIPYRYWVGFAAALFMVLGLAYFALLQLWAPNSLSPTLRQVLNTYNDRVVLVESSPVEPSLDELSHHIEFTPRSFAFQGWTLTSSDVVHLPGNSICLLRLIYRSNIDGKQQTILSYQACEGDLDIRGLRRQTVAGRDFCYGRVEGLSLVHWTSDGREHLLISSIPERNLINLALRV